MSDTKVCRTCNVEKSLDDFVGNKVKKPHCKPCYAAKARQRRVAGRTGDPSGSLSVASPVPRRPPGSPVQHLPPGSPVPMPPGTSVMVAESILREEISKLRLEVEQLRGEVRNKDARSEGEESVDYQDINWPKRDSLMELEINPINNASDIDDFREEFQNLKDDLEQNYSELLRTKEKVNNSVKRIQKIEGEIIDIVDYISLLQPPEFIVGWLTTMTKVIFGEADKEGLVGYVNEARKKPIPVKRLSVNT